MSFKFTSGFLKHFRGLPDIMSGNILSNIILNKEYARYKKGGIKETRYEIVERTIGGCADIFYDYVRENDINGIDVEYFDSIFEKMAISMLECKWSPAGRVLRNIGTREVDVHGALRLSNCAALSPNGMNLHEYGMALYDFHENQCGVGIDVYGDWDDKLIQPIVNNFIPLDKKIKRVHDVIDNILYAYTYGTELFDIQTDSDKLKELDTILRDCCDKYIKLKIDNTQFMADITNSIAFYVGNKTARGAAQILLGSPHDITFLELKDPNVNLERLQTYGSTSNNSVVLENEDDFIELDSICERIIQNGEPGLLNMVNMKKYGRIGEKVYSGINMREAHNINVNPCGEIPLEPYELCNLSMVIPMRCRDTADWINTLQYATMFSTIVSLVTCKYEKTNEIIRKNRRIGVSLGGLAELFEYYPIVKIILHINRAYDIVRNTNFRLAKILGINPAKKVTTIKPDGNTSLLLNISPGLHNPVYKNYCIRRVTIKMNDQYVKHLIECNIPYEESVTNSEKYVFEIPLHSGTRSIFDISIWEQLKRGEIMQKFWADNNISYTVYFDPEEDDLKNIISMCIPFSKTMSFIPNDDMGDYEQLPYESIERDEYIKRCKSLIIK